MKYIALLEEEKKGYGVSFPDFPACVTFGTDEDEAVDMAHESLSMFVELLRENGQSLPEPSTPSAVRALAAGRKLVTVEISEEGGDFEEIEVTMHRFLLERIVKYSDRYGVSPADFLAVAAREAMRNDVFKE
ncbi:type II toxin-antitoxin system HicB family antitoxin [Salidesulfovibrio onnuriiensis]|uniref:type II toxin-antitoxin system HicB family antitoxin n=1 Tax=Salidesulfovibrio onnuriiensis TaxID=2583823 RepID=UPI0011C6EADE|nr:type II toxin-antitoxin system HicB family antitoxin [Salidesulfovibrio onnuriiensis]